MQNIKSRSSGWLKADGRWPDFRGWSADYYACSLSPDHRDAAIEYVKTQRQHHLATTLDSELPAFYRHADLPYTPFDLR